MNTGDGQQQVAGADLRAQAQEESRFAKLNLRITELEQERKAAHREIESVHGINLHLQAQLAAVTQERDSWKMRWESSQSALTETLAGSLEISEELAQLQAHNKAMRDALEKIRDHAQYYAPNIAKAALTLTQEKPE